MPDLSPPEITALLRVLAQHQRLLDSITPVSLEELAAIEAEVATASFVPVDTSDWLHEFLYPMLDFLRKSDAGDNDSE